MLTLKRITILITFLCLSNLAFCQNEKELWSGQYRLENKKDTLHPQFYTIKKALEAKEEDLPRKYETDLLRWNMISKNGTKTDSIQLRRFLINEEYNEYEAFGWTALYKSGKINCLDAHHFFICKTTKGSKVKIEDEEFISSTGFFGIMLHQGLFELNKIE